jgi:PAS domain S-box-containing protein
MKNLNDRGILRYNDIPLKTKSGKQIYTDTYLVDKAKFAQCNIRDITERKKAEDVIRESEEKYRTLFEDAKDGIALADAETSLLVDCNQALCRMVERDKPELVGQAQNILHPPEDIIEGLSPTFHKHQIGNSGLALEDRLMTRGGRLIPVEIRAAKIRINNRDFLLGIFRDITERKLAEATLRDSEVRLNLALETNHTGVWELNLLDHTAFRTLIHDRIFGYETLLPNWTYEMFLEHVLPEDRPEVDRRFSEAIAAHSDWSFECRIHRTDGEVRWILAKGQHVKTSKGEPMQMLGIVQDITERKHAEDDLQRTLHSLSKAFNTIVQVLISAIEMRDPYTAGHQLRVADLARAIATEMELPSDKIEGIRIAASIHDIGKLSIPAEILSKPTKLSNLEFSLIKEHSLSGYEMLKDVESPWPLAQIVYQHHERMDGSGYPRNLKGDEILLEARIMAVADVVEAMASHRPYRAALGINVALEEIEKNKGILYDNAVADACLRLFREKDYQLT